MKVNRAYTCTSDRKGATSNSRKSDGRNKQTIGGRGPWSLSRVESRHTPKDGPRIAPMVTQSNLIPVSRCHLHAVSKTIIGLALVFRL